MPRPMVARMKNTIVTTRPVFDSLFFFDAMTAPSEAQVQRSDRRKTGKQGRGEKTRRTFSIPLKCKGFTGGVNRLVRASGAAPETREGLADCAGRSILSRRDNDC